MENRAIVDNVVQWIILTRKLIICSYSKHQFDEGLCINNDGIIIHDGYRHQKDNQNLWNLELYKGSTVHGLWY